MLKFFEKLALREYENFKWKAYLSFFILANTIFIQYELQEITCVKKMLSSL